MSYIQIQLNNLKIEVETIPESGKTSIQWNALPQALRADERAMRAILDALRATARQLAVTLHESLWLDLLAINKTVSAVLTCRIEETTPDLYEARCSEVANSLHAKLREAADALRQSVDLARQGIPHEISSDPDMAANPKAVYHPDSIVASMVRNLVRSGKATEVLVTVDEHAAVRLPIPPTGSVMVVDTVSPLVEIVQIVSLTRPTERPVAILRTKGGRRVVYQVAYDPDAHYSALLEAMALDRDEYAVGLTPLTELVDRRLRKAKYRLDSIRLRSPEEMIEPPIRPAPI